MKVAYIQSIGGASGDMLLGALLDLGLPLSILRQELGKLSIAGYELGVAQETRREMRGAKVTVDLEDRRRLSPPALLDIVINSPLPTEVKKPAEAVLKALWRAESRVHGEPEESLELEELGTIDTLVDVVGVAIGLKHLGVEKVYASPLVLGSAEPPRWPGGYPNPAPATLELVAMAGAPVVAERPIYQGAGELTTPTGAAIITTLATFERPAMSVTKIGVGLGTKDPESFPNVVRVWLGETAQHPVARTQGDIVLLETNLDDVTGEVLGYAQERLFALGALDVWHTPIQMKKNRPGVMLSALAPQDLEAAAVELILRETPTLGVRTRPVERYVAERESVLMELELGPVRVKVKSLDGRPVSAAPEFEDCRRIALETGLPLQEVYQQAAEEARRRFIS
jgi:pyridinium-3,5-bisthiocarboxylic acid mononucleotide nickel chelatase